MMETVERTSASEWWARHRLRYDIALAVAGVLAFVAYAATVSTLADNKPEVEITVFTTVFQALG